jgi:dihydroorotate dehydrogenase (fumarate)
MNLSTHYLGLKLKNPLVVGASPFGDNTHVALELQDAGAGAIIMRSLFEEQVDAEQRSLVHHMESTADSNPEGTSYFPAYEEYQLAPDQYLRQLAQLKSSLTIPVIASLNGCRPGGWTAYARRLESAGADAIELNLYQLATDPEMSSEEVEGELLETVRNTLASVRIPVSVKISAFHTAPVHFAKELEATGVAGVVLFNRFYQPDFDIEELEVQPQLKLSDSSELLLRLRWLAIVSPHVHCSLASSGGVHQSEDVVKALLAGADAVQIVSALLKHGPKYLTILLAGLRHWMEQHGYTSIDEVRGAMNLRRCPNPAAFERANYQRILQSWRI